MYVLPFPTKMLYRLCMATIHFLQQHGILTTKIVWYGIDFTKLYLKNKHVTFNWYSWYFNCPMGQAAISILLSFPSEHIPCAQLSPASAWTDNSILYSSVWSILLVCSIRTTLIQLQCPKWNRWTSPVGITYRQDKKMTTCILRSVTEWIKIYDFFATLP